MLKEGLTHTSRVEVTDENTAVVVGSGDMPVFATPAMIALMENAAMTAVAPELEAGSSTVGTFINVSHQKASPVGARIEATAKLVKIDGRKLTFEVSARDEKGMIGEGVHERFIVDKERFLGKLK